MSNPSRSRRLTADSHSNRPGSERSWSPYRDLSRWEEQQDDLIQFESPFRSTSGHQAQNCNLSVARVQDFYALL